MDSADQSDPVNRKDNHEGQQQRLPFDNDSKEGASSRLLSVEHDVSAPNESIAAPLQGSSQAWAASDIDLEDVILTETLRENLQKVTDKHHPSDEVPGRRQHGQDLHFEEQISDAPGKRGPNTTAAKDISSDEVPGRRQTGHLHFEKQISDAPGKRRPNTTAAKDILSDEVPGRRQPGHLHFEEQISDAPGKRGPNTTAAKGFDCTRIVKALLDHVRKIEGIAIKTMDFYINLLINNGAEEMQQQVNKDLSSWKNVQLEIAIAGESGSGKSSFINAVLGLTADDEGAAAVGCYETTMEVTKYVHPERQNIAFYDLPGVGTPKYPKDNYFELVNLDKYDFFLLLSQQRFKENDMWFANEIEKRNKRFFFVRTHIHKDMVANKRSHPRSHNRRKVIEEIRESLRKHLLDGGIHLENVYIALIDNHQTHDYDFEELLLKLVEKVSELKREALVYSLSERSRGILQIKANFLKGRMRRIALTAYVCSLKSFENREEVMKLMFHECSLYQQQLGIDTASLETIAFQLEVDKDEIVKEIEMSSYTEHDLETIFSKEWNPLNSNRRIPIIGIIPYAIRAYKNCVACLKIMLELCEKDALALNAYWLSALRRIK